MNKQKRGISLQNVQWWGPSPVVQWLGLCFRCGGHESIPSRGSKIPPAAKPVHPTCNEAD